MHSTRGMIRPSACLELIRFELIDLDGMYPHDFRTADGMETLFAEEISSFRYKK